MKFSKIKIIWFLLCLVISVVTAHAAYNDPYYFFNFIKPFSVFSLTVIIISLVVFCKRTSEYQIAEKHYLDTDERTRLGNVLLSIDKDLLVKHFSVFILNCFAQLASNTFQVLMAVQVEASKPSSLEAYVNYSSAAFGALAVFSMLWTLILPGDYYSAYKLKKYFRTA